MKGGPRLVVAVATAVLALGTTACTSTTTYAAPTSSSTTVPLPASPLPASFRLGPYLQFATTRAGWLEQSPGILFTTDAGASWKVSFGLSPKSYLGPLQFVDAEHGWALVQYDKGLIATSDGGRRWSRPSEPPQGPITSYSFSDAEEGWAVTERGVLVHTVDAGRRWSTVAAPAPGVTLCADGSDEVWLGVPGGDVYVGTVGGPWQLKLAGSTVPHIHNSVGPNPTPPPPWLTCDGPSVWALYDYGSAAGHTPFVVERTLDGGSAWAEVLGGGANFEPTPPPSPPSGTLVDLGVPGPLDAWVLAYCGPCSFGSPTLSMTTNGSSFRSVALPLPTDTYGRPVDAAFAGSQNGWVVLVENSVTRFGIPKKPLSYRTVVLATTDGGESWRTVDANVIG